MYALEVYRAIERPVPKFHAGKKVLVKNEYGGVLHATVLKVGRIWMDVQYDIYSPVKPRVSKFGITSLMEITGYGRIMTAETEEFNLQMENAAKLLDHYKIKINDTDKLSDPKFLFYLADAVEDFYGPIPPEPEF